MSLFILYVLLFLATKFFLLGTINIIRKFRGEPVKWKNFSYSTRGYYLFLLPIFLPCIILYILHPHTEWLIFFFVAGIAGMAGETVFGLYWDTLFKKRFWIYQAETIFHGYSSWLNFIPWALGGALYLVLARSTHYVPSPQEMIMFWSLFFSANICVLLLRFGQYLTSTNKKKSFEFKTLSWGNYFFIISPICIAYIGTSLIFHNYKIIVAGIVFAFIGWALEYLFGKICETYLSKRLWVYTSKSSDHGHLTPLAILPFALGGFFFISLFALILAIT